MTQKILTQRIALALIAAFSFITSVTAFAQENTLLPSLPAPIQNLANDGAQIRFLGRDYGVEGWIAIKNGQEQYFYVLPTTGGFVSGILFDEKGKAVTVNQVSRLRAQSGNEILDTLTADAPRKISEATRAEKYEFKSPSEQLFWDIENSNWVPIGKAGTPVVYSFIDPQCGHCHAMMRDMKEKVDAGKIQIRLIPVGFKEETRAQAAFLLATPSPEKVWWAHLGGDQSVLPAKRELNQQRVQKNLSIMQSWKLSVTPLIVYRGKDQKVKIIRGKPKDLDAFIADLGSRT